MLFHLGCRSNSFGGYGQRLSGNSAVVPEALIRAGASTVPCYSCQDTERRETTNPTMCPMLWSENSITGLRRQRCDARAGERRWAKRDRDGRWCQAQEFLYFDLDVFMKKSLIIKGLCLQNNIDNISLRANKLTLLFLLIMI